MVAAFTGARIFDGARILDGHAVLIDGPRIAAVVADGDVPASVPRRPVQGLLAPGFVDCQINGGGGILFNEQTSVAGIAAIAAAHRKFGTTDFLPTLITDARHKMAEALEAVEAAIPAGVPGVVGVHLEGPFLSPDRRGVHDARLMRTIDADDFALLTVPRRGRVLMTVAPEKMPAGAIARLAEANVVISAGHTAATAEIVQRALGEGLSGFTHLYNAMPPLTGREPGPVGAALDDANSYCAVIVDLHHVSATSLRVAIAAKGWRRMMLVSDAMPTVGTDDRSFTLNGQTITRTADDVLLNASGTLAGAHLDMATAVRNTVTVLGLPLEAALHMASTAPAAFLGLGGELGRIAPGYRANLVLLDDALQVSDSWIDGKSVAESG
jgi:N-acetylglucosamine-6-phosphate deacetylase